MVTEERVGFRQGQARLVKTLMAKLFRSFGTAFCESSKGCGNLSEETSAKDLNDLRERVVRLEVQLADVVKRLDSLTSYTRQLYEYLNKSSR